MKKQMQLILGMVAVLFTLAICPITSFAADEDDQELLNFLESEEAPEAPLLPGNVTIADGFKTGVGSPVGEVQVTQGTVFVIHKDSLFAYKLKKGLVVFTGDTLITEPKSRVNILMNDQSALALAAQSKLIIDKAFYDPKASTRDTELQLLFGRVRSIVNKVGPTPNYSIKTPTATAGVRGTDLAVAFGRHKKGGKKELRTTLITGPNSVVAFIGPKGKLVMVRSHSVASVFGRRPPTRPRVVGPKFTNRAMRRIGPGMARMSMPPEFD